MNKELIETLERINKQLTEARKNQSDTVIKVGLIQAETIVTQEIFNYYKQLTIK